jgi:stearoyl-CoA desaturase (Delta-9 desaturase)
MSTTRAQPLGSRPAVPDTDWAARRLAFVTVGLPTLGAAATVAFSLEYGVAASDLALLAFMYALTSFGIEAGFHRFFSHRAFAAGPGVTAFLGIAGSMAAQGSIVFWVATHRQHHAFADRDGDPHSPRPRGTGRWARLRGLWHGHVGWLFTVRRESWSSHVPDLLANRQVVRLSQRYPLWVVAGLALPALLGWAWTGSARGAVGGLLWGGLTRIFLLDHVTWGVNSIGHTLGSRPHHTRDNSHNVAALAPLSIGGSWHNNHHAEPALAHTRHAFWQLDLAGTAITLLERMGLVSDVRHRPGPAQEKGSNAHVRDLR